MQLRHRVGGGAGRVVGIPPQVYFARRLTERPGWSAARCEVKQNPDPGSPAPRTHTAVNSLARCRFARLERVVSRWLLGNRARPRRRLSPHLVALRMAVWRGDARLCPRNHFWHQCRNLFVDPNGCGPLRRGRRARAAHPPGKPFADPYKSKTSCCARQCEDRKSW
jgi:hypothetical protein